MLALLASPGANTPKPTINVVLNRYKVMAHATGAVQSGRTATPSDGACNYRVSEKQINTQFQFDIVTLVVVPAVHYSATMNSYFIKFPQKQFIIF